MSAAKNLKRGVSVGGRYEAFATARIIPRCPNCLMSNTRDLDKCAFCGNALERREVSHVKSVTSDMGTAIHLCFANFMMKTADALRRIAERIKP